MSGQLRDEEKFTVGGVKEAVGHAFVRSVEVDRDAGVHGVVTVALRVVRPSTKLWVGGRKRVPAELAGVVSTSWKGWSGPCRLDALVGLCMTDGRIRYVQVRRLSRRAR